MIEFLNNFHFLRPWFLLLLLVPMFLYFKTRAKQITTDSAWAKVCDKPLLDFLLIKRPKTGKKSISLLRLLILLILPLSLAGPCWQKQENPALNVDNPLVIALNMSGGMWSKNVYPSRAERAKFLIKDILKGIDASETALEVYSREPFMISPISEDKNLIDNLLPAITYDIMPENGDRLDRAIELAVERLKNAHYQDGNIIVLTYDVGERFDLALESAAKAAADGYKINVIDINQQKNSKLEMIADKGRGIYVGYNENLSPLFSAINDVGEYKFKQSKNMQTVWFDDGYYLLFLPAILLLYFFRKNAVVLAIMLFLSTQHASAGWFLNNNQEAMQAFEKGDFNTASQKFDDQKWKASAAYKNGEYEKSATIFSAFDDTENLYNYGNALAKSGKIKEAIEKYEEVLKQNPEHEDAKFNLEYLKKQQNQNQQQQQNKKQNEQQQSEQEQQQNSQPQNQENEQNNPQNNQQEQQQSEQNEQQQNFQNDDDEKNGEQSADSQNETPAGEQETKDEKNDNEPLQNEEESQDSDELKQAQSLSSGDKQNDEEQQKIRARKQKFREIEEDKGGLLREFIKKEYLRKRYEK